MIRKEAILNLLILSIIPFYLFFPSRTYSIDDFLYATTIEEGNFKSIWMFHPGHLLYGFSGWPIYKLINLMGLSARGIYCLTTMNSIAGILTLVLFYIFSRSFIKDKVSSVLATLFLAFTIGFWGQATGAGVYPFENLFLVLSFFFIYRAIVDDKWIDFLLAGLFAGMATLYFIFDILLILIFSMTYLFYNKKLNKKIFIFLFSFSFITALAYYVVAFVIVSVRDLGGFLKWLYPETMPEYLSPNPYLSIPYNIYGQVRAIFSVEPVKNLFLNRYTAMVILSFIALLFAASLTLYLFIGFCKRLRLIWQNRRLLLSFTLFWAIIFLIPFSWHSPGNMRFFIRNIIPLSFLIGVFGQASLKIRKILSLLILSLFLLNFFGQILPFSEPGYSEDLRFAKFIYANIAKDSLVLMPGTGESSLGAYLAYFFKIETGSFRYSFTRKGPPLERTIENFLECNRKVYIVSDLKKITSAIILKPLDQHRPEFAIEGKIVQCFLRRNNYQLIFINKYKDAYNYKGELYRLAKGQGDSKFK